MTRRLVHRLSRLALAAAMLLATEPSTARADLVADWCRLDAPAAWQAGGGRGCPPPADPQTLPEEMTVPLPCGRAAVFRRVTVPSDSPLDHELVWLGAPDTGSEAAGDLGGVVNAPRALPLAGSFGVDGGRAYYIGKYELPAHHWDLFVRGLMSTDDGPPALHDTAACAGYDQAVARLSPSRVLPASDLSWYDAIAFTRAWNAWLMAADRVRVPQRPPLVPWEQGTPAYLRLPTEAEWEFAARGGVARREDAVTARTHLVRDPDSGELRPGRLDEIAVLTSGGSAAAARRSPLHGIGRRLPNAVGLYDTIGNVDEIVFDLFTLTRPDRPHGQSGGYVVKGGNVFTPPTGLSIAHRREVPFFDLRGERRSATTGVRLLLAPPVFVSARSADGDWRSGLHNPDQIAALGRARKALVQTDHAVRDAVQDQVARLGRDAEEGRLATETLGAQLRDLQASLDRSNADLNVRERDVLRQQIQSVMLIGKTIADVGTNIFVVRRDLDQLLREAGTAGQEAGLAARIDTLRQALQDQEQSLTAAFGFYVGNIAALAEQPPAIMDDTITHVRRGLGRQGLDILFPALEHVTRHVADMRAAGGSLNDAQARDWLYTLDRTRRLRDERFGARD